MRQCWSEGALKAYLDRELPPEDMERVAAHLGACSRCESRRALLAGRAARISALMDALPEPDRVVALPLITRQPRAVWPWAAAAAGAAALAIAFLAAKPVAPVIPPPVSSVAQALPPSVHIPELRPAARAPLRAAKPHPTADYYLALDDEPIETGVVVRVALGPAEVPADVIFDQDGRARAIRLVR